MLECATTLSGYGAIWADNTAAFRCRACGQILKLDLRRLALDGHGRERLADIPFECDCGSSDHDVIAEPTPAG